MNKTPMDVEIKRLEKALSPRILRLRGLEKLREEYLSLIAPRRSIGPWRVPNAAGEASQE